MSTNPVEWLTVPEIAKELGVTPSRIRTLIATGSLTGGIQRTGAWFFPRSVVDEFKSRPKSKGGRPKKSV